VNGRDIQSVAEEIAGADIMATAVGVNVLPRIAKPFAEGLKLRWQLVKENPLNIIICENLLDANHYLWQVS
jgi:mannitol-1-phosphate 5-dehydrogenase